MFTINKQQLDMLQLNKYLLGNSSKLMKYFNGVDPFIDLTVTSPPYWDAKQYGEVAQTGFGQSYKAYLNTLERTFRAIYTLSKPTASLYLNIDTIKRDGKVMRLQDDISKRLEKIGWIHQDTIIWDKGKTLPWSPKGQMRNIFEYILFFTKTTDYKYNIDAIKTVDELMEWWQDYPERYSPDGKVPDNIWRFNIPTQGSWGTKSFDEEEFRHACPFPPEMMARIIKLSSDETEVVVDPFAGTGVLLATAELLGRKYLGLDTNEQYKNIFEKVTRPLVAKQWPQINRYYKLQEHMKVIMRSTIYRLRMLKYPKALIKRLKQTDGFDNSSLKFTLIFAIQEPLKPEEANTDSKKEKIVGKVRYFLCLETTDEVRSVVQSVIDKIIRKAPFSKYGLITEVTVVDMNDLRKKLRAYDSNLPLYLYPKGNTRSYSKMVHRRDTLRMLTKFEHLLLMDKDIPALISNISIQEQEYSMIPAEKYSKKTLLSPFAGIGID